MAQKMTEENKPFVMATLSEVAYKDLEEASKTFEHFRFTEYKFIDRDGAQCYLISVSYTHLTLPTKRIV